MKTSAIIADWPLPLNVFVVSLVIGAATIACVAGAAKPRKDLALRWIVAAATAVPGLILLLGLGFAASMPQLVHASSGPVLIGGGLKPPGSSVAGTLCALFAITQLAGLTFTGIACAGQADAPAPMHAAGAVTGCVFLGVLALLAWLGASQALAGASL